MSEKKHLEINQELIIQGANGWQCWHVYTYIEIQNNMCDNFYPLKYSMFLASLISNKDRLNLQ
jgi:hypothetical protein